MSRPALSVFLPSYNKHAYCVEAIESVTSQDFGSWELWILENSTDGGRTRDAIRSQVAVDADPRIIYEEIDVPDEVRASVYVTPWLLNKYYAHARGEAILYLSDDDLFTPGALRVLARWFGLNPDKAVVYFGLKISRAPQPGDGRDGPWAGEIPAMLTRGKDGETRFVDCQIDGGQLAHRTSALAAIDRPWFHEARDAGASHCDGLFMARLAEALTFHPLDFHGATHRITPISTWTRT